MKKPTPSYYDLMRNAIVGALLKQITIESMEMINAIITYLQ